MSSSEAQKSPVHQSTEDSTAEPTNQVGPSTLPGDASRPAPGDHVPRDAADLKNRPDTAMGVPGNFERGAAKADVRPDTDEDTNPPGQSAIGGGPGAADSSSGGGAGAGIPGGGTDMRSGGAFSGGDADQDRHKLFPDAGTGPATHRRDETAGGKDGDPSTYGGPLDLDDPDAV